MQQTSTKWLQNETWVGEESDPLGIVQEIEIWPYYQMVYAQTRNFPGELGAWNSLRFLVINRSPNLGQMTRRSDSKQKYKNLPISGLCHPSGMKIKENK